LSQIQFWMLVIFVALAPARALAGPVTLTSADLRVVTSADATNMQTSETAHDEDSQTGDLTTRSVSAEATAAFPFGGTLAFPVTRSRATANLSETANELVLDGVSNTLIGVKSTPFSGKGSAQSTATVGFSVTVPGAYQLNYEALVLASTPSLGSKLSIDLRNAANSALLSLSFAGPFTQETNSRSVNLSAGDYSLVVDALAPADLTNLFGVSDSGDITYRVTLAAGGSGGNGAGGGGGTAIPLPPSVLTGLMMLPLSLWVARRMRVRLS
jgi:hypothetical protein